MNNKLIISSNNIEFLKWLAIIFMVIDHTMKIYDLSAFHYIPVLFEVGRMSFPLFAIVLTYNYINHSKDKVLYLKRLFVFFLVSQAFFMYAFRTLDLNIFYVLFAGSLSYFLIKEITKDNLVFWKKSLLFVSFIAINIIGAMYSDYKPFGVLFVLVTFFLIEYNKPFLWALFGFFILLINYIYFSFISSSIGLVLSMLLSIYLVKLSLKKEFFYVKRVNKWFFYSFYPLHLLIIVLFYKFILGV